MKRTNYVFAMIACLLGFDSALHAAPVMTAKQKLDKLLVKKSRTAWTFKVGYSGILEYPLSKVTGLKVPTNWRAKATFVNPKRATREALPTKYDWREQVAGGLPPIKNQGQCGSCWAFGTVGVLESIVKIRDGKEKRFSEQYLVACDRQSYGCSGGYYAHYLHKSPGAVPEESFQYQESDSACPQNLPHSDSIVDWAYVGGSDQASPTVEQIKQAIFTYGPVAVTVAATDSFAAYRSGVFNDCTNEQTNHIVDLVGWDEEKKAWILRNSWGADWGDNGYMNIRYGCSRVAETATFVTYKAACTPQPLAYAGSDQSIQRGQSVLIGGMPVPGQTYQWSPSEGLDDPTSAMPLASPTHTVTYTLKTTSSCGTGTKNVTVAVQ